MAKKKEETTEEVIAPVEAPEEVVAPAEEVAPQPTPAKAPVATSVAVDPYVLAIEERRAKQLGLVHANHTVGTPEALGSVVVE